jgi:hypothetical protein
MRFGEITRGHEDCRVEEIDVWLGTISGTEVQASCIMGNFHVVLLFICCSLWMTCLLLLKTCLRLRD